MRSYRVSRYEFERQTLRQEKDVGIATLLLTTSKNK